MKISKNKENFTLFRGEGEIPRGCIAFFDSGIGGLAMLKECILRGLEGNVIYYGDSLHAPYGEKEEWEIDGYFQTAMEWFLSSGVERVIVACNTVSLVTKRLWVSYPIPIYGTYPPIASVKEEGRVFLFATTQAIQILCGRVRAREGLYLIPLPTLAREIERNFERPSSVPLQGLLPVGKPSAVVLGCTHYSFLKKQFEQIYHAPVYDSAFYSAEEVMKKLQPFLTTQKKRREKMDGEEDAFYANEGKYPFLRLCSEGHKVNVFFAGSGKKRCWWLCEQMFVSNIGQK